ncbi:MAG: TetR/AcrR family transcriptional regulator [Gemmobacter sp.]|jgi:AcrR family transcriptional regulator
MARKVGSHAGTTGPRVRAAALRLFAREGYAAVSMRAIAAEVGVQAGALYLYTPDKQTLLFDLMREHLEEVRAAWAAVRPDPAPPAERLAAFARFHVNHHIDRPEAVFIAYMELRALTPENFARIEALRRAYEGELEAILREGACSGAFRLPDARLAARALIAMLTGVTTWYRAGGPMSRAEVAEAYAALALRAVGAPA